MLRVVYFPTSALLKNLANIHSILFLSFVTVSLENPVNIVDTASIVGKKEGEGPLASYFDYILENFDSLQCKYICVPVGGDIDELCKERGLEVITQGMNAVCYQLR